MTRAGRVILALLVVATFGAFFAAQRLKHTPEPAQQIKGEELFSPEAGGEKTPRAVRLSFVVKAADDYTVEVIDGDGDVVRTLVRDLPSKKYRKLPAMTWDGRDDAGRMAADGRYRYRVSLRKGGRSIVLPKSVTLDTTPPKVVVTAIGPSSKPGAELLPNDSGKVTIHTGAAGSNGRVWIYKTSPGTPRLVTALKLAPGQRTVDWNGRVDGRRVSAGTYLAVARWRDKAGNLGTSVPLDREGLPVIGYGQQLPGRGGITVRYLEVQPPTSAVPAGQIVGVNVDARGGCFTWTLRPVGGVPVRRSSRPSCHSPYRLRVPGGSSRVYLFEARTRTRSATVPIAVQGRDHRPVLVVLPLMTWQGRNPVDDDGDGAADTLDRGVGVGVENRVLALGRLPAGFADADGPLLAFLRNKGRRFDVTTDYDLARGGGPKLSDYRGVILPGDVRWLTPRLSLDLRRWVRGGGRVLSIGLDSLRRDASLSPKGRLVRPTAPSQANLFGTALARPVRKPATLTADVDQLQLFSGKVLGGTGQFAAPSGYEATTALSPSERLAASAVTDDGTNVIVATRFGKGLVIRTGIARFATRLNADNNSGQLVLRAWELLARR